MWASREMREDADETRRLRGSGRPGGGSAAGGEDDERAPESDADSEAACARSEPDTGCIMPSGRPGSRDNPVTSALGIGTRVRRRRSTRTMVTIRALGIVAVLVLAGCSPVPPSLIPHSTPTIAPQSTPAPPTAFPSPSAIPTPPPTAPPSSAGLTSASIHPESVTFISPDVGWVLGLSLCDAKPCLRLAKTVNAGLSWNWIPGGNVPDLSTSSQWELRFADGDNGWISGPETLFDT